MTTLQVTRMNVLGVLSGDPGGYELVVRLMDDVGAVEDYHDEVCVPRDMPALRLGSGVPPAHAYTEAMNVPCPQ